MDFGSSPVVFSSRFQSSIKGYIDIIFIPKRDHKNEGIINPLIEFIQKEIKHMLKKNVDIVPLRLCYDSSGIVKQYILEVSYEIYKPKSNFTNRYLSWIKSKLISLQSNLFNICLVSYSSYYNRELRFNYFLRIIFPQNHSSVYVHYIDKDMKYHLKTMDEYLNSSIKIDRFDGSLISSENNTLFIYFTLTHRIYTNTVIIMKELKNKSQNYYPISLLRAVLDKTVNELCTEVCKKLRPYLDPFIRLVAINRVSINCNNSKIGYLYSITIPSDGMKIYGKKLFNILERESLICRKRFANMSDGFVLCNMFTVLSQLIDNRSPHYPIICSNKLLMTPENLEPVLRTMLEKRYGFDNKIISIENIDF